MILDLRRKLANEISLKENALKNFQELNLAGVAKVNQLKRDIESLNQAVVKAREETLQQAEAAYASKKAEYERDISALKDQVRTASAEGYQRGVDANAETVRVLQKANESLGAQIEQAKLDANAVPALQKQIERITIELNDAKTRAERTEATLSAAQENYDREIRKAQEEKQIADTEIQSRNQELLQATRTISEIKSQLESAQKNSTALAELYATKAELSLVRTELEAAKKDAENSKAAVLRLEKDLVESRALLGSKSEEYAAESVKLQQEMLSKDGQILALTNEKSSLQGQITSLNTQLEALRTSPPLEIQSLAESEREALSKEYEAQISRLDAKLRTTSGELEALKTENAALRQKLNATEKDLSTAQQDKLEAETALKLTRSTLATRETELSEARKNEAKATGLLAEQQASNALQALMSERADTDPSTKLAEAEAKRLSNAQESYKTQAARTTTFNDTFIRLNAVYKAILVTYQRTFGLKEEATPILKANETYLRDKGALLLQLQQLKPANTILDVEKQIKEAAEAEQALLGRYIETLNEISDNLAVSLPGLIRNREKKFADEISRLKGQLSVSKGQSDQCRRQIEETNKSLEEAERSFKAARLLLETRFKTAQGDLLTVQAQLLQAQTDLKNAEAELDVARRNYDVCETTTKTEALAAKERAEQAVVENKAIIDRLEKEVEAAKDSCEEITREQVRASEEYRLLEQRLREAEDEASEKQAELVSSGDEVADLKENIQSLTALLTQTQETLSAKTAACTEAREKLTRELSEAKGEIADYIQKLAISESRYRALNVEKTKLSDQLRAATTKTLGLEAQLLAKQEEVRAIQARAKAETDSYTVRRKELNDKLATKNKELSGAIAQKNEAETSLERLQSDLETCEASKTPVSASLLAEIAQSKAQAEQSRLLASQVEKDTQQCKIQIDELVRQHQDRIADLSKDQQALVDAKAAVEKYSLEITQLRSDKDAISSLYDQEKERLTEAISEYTKQVSDLNTRIASLEAQLVESVRSKEACLADLAAKDAEIKMLAKPTPSAPTISQLSQLRTQVATLQNQLRQANASMSADQAEIATLKSELARAQSQLTATSLRLEQALRGATTEPAVRRAATVPAPTAIAAPAVGPAMPATSSAMPAVASAVRSPVMPVVSADPIIAFRNALYQAVKQYRQATASIVTSTGQAVDRKLNPIPVPSTGSWPKIPSILLEGERPLRIVLPSFDKVDTKVAWLVAGLLSLSKMEEAWAGVSWKLLKEDSKRDRLVVVPPKGYPLTDFSEYIPGQMIVPVLLSLNRIYFEGGECGLSDLTLSGSSGFYKIKGITTDKKALARGINRRDEALAQIEAVYREAGNSINPALHAPDLKAAGFTEQEISWIQMISQTLNPDTSNMYLFAEMLYHLS